MASPRKYPNSDGRATNVSKQAPQFTLFVRLPFPRGEFVDPPPVSIEHFVRTNDDA